jgi:hypothetical protein
MLFVSAVVFAAFAVLYLIVNSSIPGTWKFALGLLEMFIVGQLLIKKYSLKGEYGIIMLRTKKGLKIINELARNQKFWNFFAEVGLVISYGALSFVLMRKNVSAKSGIVGFSLLLFLSMFVVPLILPFLSANIQGIVSVSDGSSVSKSSFLLPFSLLILLGGGFFAVLLLGLLYYGFVVLYSLISTLAFGTTAMATTKAGATLLIPGVNLPFFEGIIALIVILVVHEGAHAILGRIARVPILSSGVVLFGVIPVGAFVEPDEEYLKRVEVNKQTKVIVAGSTSNFMTSIVFFILFIGFLLATMPYRETGLLVIDGMEKGTVIYTVNGQDALLLQNATFSANQTIALTTSKGDIFLKTNNEGKLGILYYPLNSLLIAKFNSSILDFIFTTLGLIFSLNFVIGSMNLLPLPFFDGFRIMELNIKNQKVVDGLMYLTLGGFIMNLVPHLF